MKHLPFLIGSLILGACSKPQPETNVGGVATTSGSSITITSSQYEAANIGLGKLERKSIGTTLQVNGALDVPPQNLVTIAAPMGGFVKSTKLLQGMKVRKGEILATMEHQDYIQLQQDYLESKSKLEFSEMEYNRQLELSKENINTQKALQQARAQYQTLKASVDGLKAKLAMINISATSLADGNIRTTINLPSPISGFVTEVNVNLGQFVNAADVMFKIVNIEHLHAELQVYERDINRIQIGQKVLFELANETTNRTASVYLIGKEISPDRTVRIHCHLDEEDENLLPGMYVTASIQTAMHEADVLPVAAIVNFEGADYIFTAMEGTSKFEMVEVDTGGSTAEVIEVQLPPGFDKTKSIVIRGAFDLLGMLKNSQDD